jgi:hypothetical protein
VSRFLSGLISQLRNSFCHLHSYWIVGRSQNSEEVKESNYLFIWRIKEKKTFSAIYYLRYIRKYAESKFVESFQFENCSTRKILLYCCREKLAFCDFLLLPMSLIHSCPNLNYHIIRDFIFNNIESESEYIRQENLLFPCNIGTLFSSYTISFQSLGDCVHLCVCVCVRKNYLGSSKVTGRRISYLCWIRFSNFCAIFCFE